MIDMSDLLSEGSAAKQARFERTKEFRAGQNITRDYIVYMYMYLDVDEEKRENQEAQRRCSDLYIYKVQEDFKE